MVAQREASLAHWEVAMTESGWVGCGQASSVDLGRGGSQVFACFVSMLFQSIKGKRR